MYKNLILEKFGRIGVIRINRPYIKNAINENTLLELRDSIREFRNNDKIKALMITGVENSFSAGMDLKSVHGLPPSKVRWIASLGRLVLLEINTGVEFETDPVKFFNDILEKKGFQYKIGKNWKPIIAAINGYALGGGLELACSCDFRFVCTSAILGYPEIDLRIFPSWGGTQFTTKIIGTSKSQQLIFTCEKISAYKAKELGLVNDVFNDDILFEKSLEFTKKISRKDISLLRDVKFMIEQSFGDKLIKGLSLEYASTTHW
ncbi:MAG: enoyl-CoA hydratase/isomerase family protein [Candidatus Helarchaeota archaeon]